MNNGTGVVGVGPVTVFVDRTEISGNLFGWTAAGGAVVNSFSNNAVLGNGDDTLNGVTQIPTQ